ncbi:putative glucose transporter rco-3 [Drepanopeziza brunnea f. sp. 'multigermtubi' MB_m1]|uniref:Putative glucose transporter rco-3 n=2 Tax=Drepanopeziza brunnea f. sp. 'multigermtubi' TaxID=698441 RepID=K1X0D7_MARBU|nr:putative glucose transporter rco-3 [Drepanopeziza brunnea f. sp. 'multigermtubi' MB_m1]EKD18447.1 putative glucose transporter rco-3 [Drepanopeziza brunnea f. sp. 'multigermtubi' MB_m1]
MSAPAIGYTSAKTPTNLHPKLLDDNIDPYPRRPDKPSSSTMAIAMAWQKPDNVAGSSAPAIMIGLFVATGGLLFGYDTGIISGILAMKAFRDEFSTGYVDLHDHLPNVSPAQSSVIVAILSAGTFFGALLAAPMGDKLGRRISLIIAVAIFAIGTLLQTVALAIMLLVWGRFFAGLGVGTISVLVPLYQSEMAPKWIRGTLVCAYQLAITTGLLLAAIVNIFTESIPHTNAFRIPLALQFIWAGTLLLGLLLLPETPRYLIKRGSHAAAALSLSRLRRLDITHPALVEELAEIQANHEYELSLGPSTYRDVFLGSPHLGRRLLTGCGLQILQQLSGCNFIFYYGTTFFTRIGIQSPYIVALVVAVVNVVSTIPSMFLVESLGRRRLLMFGAGGMAICQLVVASVGTAIPNSYAANMILIVFVCIYLAFFAASWGPVAWVVTSEIYPLKIRAKSMSISTASNWLLNFSLAYGTPYLVNSGHGYANLQARVFFIWGTFCAISVLFVWLMVYETSRISLEQIDEMYERVDHAWNSRAFEPSWSFQVMRDEGVSASGIQLTDTEESRRRTGTWTSTAESGTTMTEEDKIIAQLGDVDLSY